MCHIRAGGRLFLKGDAMKKMGGKTKILKGRSKLGQGWGGWGGGGVALKREGWTPLTNFALVLKNLCGKLRELHMSGKTNFTY